MRTAGFWFLGLLLAFIVASSPSAVSADGRDDRPSGRALTVMTQNLYVGFDATSVFAAPDFDSFQVAAKAAWDNANATNFPERAEALAVVIARDKPDVIGLQEAYIWRTGPIDPDAQATDVLWDFTQLLIDTLAQRGLHYSVTASITNLDVEAPLVVEEIDIRVTDQDVILVRTDRGGRGIKVSNPQGENFVAALEIPFLTGPLTVHRGWTSVDMKFRGQNTRIVNTHLEAFVPQVRDAQASELLAGPLAFSGPVVLIGDLNALPDGTDQGTYEAIISSGFVDSWTAVHHGAPGYTWGHAPDLRNEDANLTQRIDYVLFRESPRTRIGTQDADVVGDEQSDRSVTGLWPSDHAGVVADLVIRGDDAGDEDDDGGDGDDDDDDAGDEDDDDD